MEHKTSHNQHCAALPVVQSDALPEALWEVLQTQLADQKIHAHADCNL